jgi:hypothetical protein
MDGDRSKAPLAEVSNQLQAVRDAVNGSAEHGSLFEFKEDLELALGFDCKCGWVKLLGAAETISLDGGQATVDAFKSYSIVQALRANLRAP